jgi:hypothetical protein
MRESGLSGEQLARDGRLARARRRRQDEQHAATLGAGQSVESIGFADDGMGANSAQWDRVKSRARDRDKSRLDRRWLIATGADHHRRRGDPAGMGRTPICTVRHDPLMARHGELEPRTASNSATGIRSAMSSTG